MPDKSMLCELVIPQGWTHQHYGLVVCDLVRHVAHAFHVTEPEVWEWVDKERYHPTTDIKEIPIT